MTATIDYYFTTISPWAYLGHDAFREIAARHGATINYRPVNLGPVFENSGGLPFAKRHPARQRYRLVELQRWREKRDRVLNLTPAHFPVDPSIADCMTIALSVEGRDPGDFQRRAFEAVWVHNDDVSNPDRVASIADGLGLPGQDLVAAAHSSAVKARYDENRDAAIQVEIIGSPCYVLNGEPFWGQDRLDLLDDALASGRAPYRP